MYAILLLETMDLERTVQIYLKQAKQSEKPLLLGFSGGEDSLALAHCLIRLGIDFQIAHYDHGWRETSGEEAKQLGEWAARLGIPFHTCRSPCKIANELAAREERYAFFQSIFEKSPFQALVLAHHRDDQVETILKRVFEGAHLSTLKGMSPARQMEEMPLWRPLLGIPKEVIRAYLQNHKLKAIDDPTNRDPKYLRARMRTDLVPLLSQNFGKAISNSILRIGHYSAELEDYLHQQTQRLQPIEGPFGLRWDFSAAHPIEIRFVLRKQGLIPSEPVFEKILNAIAEGRANYWIDQKCAVDRGHFFVLKALPPRFPENVPFKEGKVKSNGWQWEINLSQNLKTSPQDWRHWWEGKILVNIPPGIYTFGTLNPSLRKFQNARQVPAFLRDTLPTLLSNGQPLGEFLTGKSLPLPTQNPLCLSLKIKYVNLGF